MRWGVAASWAFCSRGVRFRAAAGGQPASRHRTLGVGDMRSISHHPAECWDGSDSLGDSGGQGRRWFYVSWQSASFLGNQRHHSCEDKSRVHFWSLSYKNCKYIRTGVCTRTHTHTHLEVSRKSHTKVLTVFYTQWWDLEFVFHSALSLFFKSSTMHTIILL